MNLFGLNFQGWKLNTKLDYIFFFSFIIIGVLAFYIAIKQLNKMRTDENGRKRVIKEFKKLIKKPVLICEKDFVNIFDKPDIVDIILLDKGLFLIKAYGWGTKIYSSGNEKSWIREDAKRTESFDNPNIILSEIEKNIKAELKKENIQNINIYPIVVFAENYQEPEIYVGNDKTVVSYKNMKKWYKNIKKSAYAIDFDSVSRAINNIQ